MIARRHDQRGAPVLDDLQDAAARGRDDRSGAGQRLGDAEPERLLQGGVDVDIRRPMKLASRRGERMYPIRRTRCRTRNAPRTLRPPPRGARADLSGPARASSPSGPAHRREVLERVFHPLIGDEEKRLSDRARSPSSCRAAAWSPGENVSRSTPPGMSFQSSTAGASNERLARSSIHWISAETNRRASPRSVALRRQFMRVASRRSPAVLLRSGHWPQPVFQRGQPIADRRSGR